MSGTSGANALQSFTSPDFGEIRVLTIGGEPWFVGRDVAAALGYKSIKDTLRRRVDPEDKQIIQRSQIADLDSNAAQSSQFADLEAGLAATLEDMPNRGLAIINESGLYSLMMTSQLPTAKAFKRWVTSEVLPTIRKTGRYAVGGGQDTGGEAGKALPPAPAPVDAMKLIEKLVMDHDARLRAAEIKVEKMDADIRRLCDTIGLVSQDWEKVSRRWESISNKWTDMNGSMDILLYILEKKYGPFQHSPSAEGRS